MTDIRTGSTWREWDLHIHSPLSFLNNQYPRLANGPDWEAYIARLLGANLAVAGITDYFSIDGYKELRRFQSEGRLPGVILLPNIEFRLNTFVVRRDHADRRLNLHVIFSDEVDPQDIEEHFLHDLEFTFDGDERRKLKRSNLEDAGRRLQQAHAEFRSRTAIDVGASTAVVDDEQISTLLASDSRFRGKYVIVLAEEDWNLIDWDGAGHVQRKRLLQKADLVFSGKQKTIEWCLGATPYANGPIAFINEFHSLKACIHGSDAHSLPGIGSGSCSLRGLSTHTCTSDGTSCDQRRCWIKADPTFEGLRQLLYEPRDRVFIGRTPPASAKSRFTLASVVIPEHRINADLNLARTELSLNDGLISVIGVRGSGKTALLDLVAHCYRDRTASLDPNSFVRRVATDSPGLAWSLTLRDGTVFYKTLSSRAIIESTPPTYIAQGELESHISDAQRLAAHVQSLLFTSPSLADSQIVFDYQSHHDSLLRSATGLHDISDAVDSLELATGGEAREVLRQRGIAIAAELLDTDAIIAQLAKHLTPTELAAATEAQARVDALRASIRDLETLRDVIDAVMIDVRDTLPDIARRIESVRTAASTLGLQPGDLADVTYPTTASLTELRADVAARLLRDVTALEREATGLRTRESRLQDHGRRTARRSEILAQQVEHVAADAALRGKVTALELRTQELQDSFQALLSAVHAARDKYTQIVSAFAVDRSDILADLSFVPEIVFDEERLLQTAESVLDQRKVDIRREASVFNSLLAAYRGFCTGDATQVPAIVRETLRLHVELTNKTKQALPQAGRALKRALWSHYLLVRPIVRYKNIALAKLSLGQKATVLVKMYLAHGDSPILIDSHDEHMDNEFIMAELVRALRAAKVKRQIIIASNNGNVVVNSDAEQVIIANFSAGTVSYESGSLENPTIRERALGVLEGGEDAFRRRQNKYRMT